MRHLRWDEAGAKGKAEGKRENSLLTADRQVAHQMSSPRIDEPRVLATFAGSAAGHVRCCKLCGAGAPARNEGE
jgi:hypothetical protein